MNDDVFRDDASTSKLADTDGGIDELPTLAQLLKDTVERASRGVSNSSNGKAAAEASSNDQQGLPSLPSLTSATSRAYISSLLSKDLPSLLREPDELAKQSELLDGDLANLCYRSTGDLLGVGECVDGVEDGFREMQGTLDVLLQTTEELSSSCGAFTTSVTPILSSRTRLNLVRSNIANIEDILSIPRLVSTCVRGGWWSEAMELAYRARDLEQILKRTPASKAEGKRQSLLGRVRQEVEVEIKTLRGRIIEGLRGRALKLPSAVKSISLLRRMSATSLSPTEEQRQNAVNSLSESELRMVFLVSRWDCLRSQLDQLDVSAGSGASSDDRLRYVKRWIEVWREVVGETVTIYNEIFLSPPGSSSLSSQFSPTPSPSLHNKSDPLSLNSQAESSLNRLHLTSPHTPLPIFLSQALSSLSQLLSSHLPSITPISALASLQTQLSYCATAFSKFGFDFRYLPNNLIVSRVKEVTVERFAQASESFSRDLDRTRKKATSGNNARTSASAQRFSFTFNALVASESRQAVLNLQPDPTTNSEKPKSSQPSSAIALFPPLAKLLNAHASALNDLRLLPLTSLYAALQQAQLEQLSQCAQYLEELLLLVCNPVEQSGRRDSILDGSVISEEADEAEQDQQIAKAFATTFAIEVVPWCTWALGSGVYPGISSERGEEAANNLENACARVFEAAKISKEAAGIQEEPSNKVAEEEPPAQVNGHGHSASPTIEADAVTDAPEVPIAEAALEDKRQSDGIKEAEGPDASGGEAVVTTDA